MDDFAVVRLKTKEGTFYYRNISGEEFIFITVLNKFQEIAAGENYSHYSFILIRKQKACNCNDFVEEQLFRDTCLSLCTPGIKSTTSATSIF